MLEIVKGANTPVPTEIVRPTARFARGQADVSAYVLDGSGKVRGDEDMIFFNQPATSDRTIALDGATFTIDLSRIAAEVERIAICAVPEQGTVADLGRIDLETPGIVAFSQDTAGMREAAIIIGEFYRRAGAWKFRAVAQGFDGGLAPLSRHFGIVVADDEPVAAATAPAKVDLRKQRIVSLEKRDPKLVSLAKAAAVSLEKKALAGATAKVVLVLDISASMHGRYRSGEVDRLVQRILALGLNMDDDGAIEVYAFGTGAYRVGVADIDTYQNFVPELLRKHDLEGSTHYGATIRMIRKDFAAQADFGRVPVYVMFVTDGDTMDRALTEKQIREASSEGIFWQFMGIGGGGFLSSGFKFLEKLDDLSGRAVDNCDFFSVPSADSHSDAELYDKLMTEYPGWLKSAAAAGILR